MFSISSLEAVVVIIENVAIPDACNKGFVPPSPLTALKPIHFVALEAEEPACSVRQPGDAPPTLAVAERIVYVPALINRSFPFSMRLPALPGLGNAPPILPAPFE